MLAIPGTLMTWCTNSPENSKGGGERCSDGRVEEAKGESMVWDFRRGRQGPWEFAREDKDNWVKGHTIRYTESINIWILIIPQIML